MLSECDVEIIIWSRKSLQDPAFLRLIIWLRSRDCSKNDTVPVMFRHATTFVFSRLKRRLFYKCHSDNGFKLSCQLQQSGCVCIRLNILNKTAKWIKVKCEILRRVSLANKIKKMLHKNRTRRDTWRRPVRARMTFHDFSTGMSVEQITKEPLKPPPSNSNTITFCPIKVCY